MLTILLAFIIPDTPKAVREHVSKEQVVVSETILRMEVNRRNGQDGLTDSDVQQIRRRMQVVTIAKRDDVDSPVPSADLEFQMLSDRTLSPPGDEKEGQVPSRRLP
jgi:hypothetical protein